MLFEADYAKNYASIMYQCLFLKKSDTGIIFKYVTSLQLVAMTTRYFFVCEKLAKACEGWLASY